MPITEYRILLEQAFNIACLGSGMGGFEFQTEADKYAEMAEQIEEFRKQGRL